MGFRIVDLQGATIPLSGTELLEIEQGGNSRKIALSDLLPGFDDALRAELAAENGSELIGYGGRTVFDKLAEAISIKDFGAVGDGATDDTAAIQAAIDAVKAAGGGIVRIPKGTYIVSATITFQSRVHIVGDGREVSIIKVADGSLQPAVIGNSPELSFQGTLQASVCGISLIGNANTLHGMDLQAVNRCFFGDIRIKSLSATTGAGPDGTWAAIGVLMRTWNDGSSPTFRVCSRNTFQHVYILDSPNSLLLDSAAGDLGTHAANLNTFDRCYFAGYTNRGVSVVEGEGNTFTGCSATTSNNNTIAYYVNDTVTTFVGCHADSANGANIGAGTDAWGFPTGILDNNNTGWYITDTAGGTEIVNLLGNGCRKRIDYSSATAFSQTSVHRYQYNWVGIQRVGTLLVDSGVTVSNGQLLATRASGTVAQLTSGSSASTNLLRMKSALSATGVDLQITGANRFTILNRENTDTDFGNNGATTLRLAAGGHLHPITDNANSLGLAGNRWSVVYAATGTINTSDERAKTPAQPIDDAVLRAWARVEYCQFKFLDAVEHKGDAARWHFGLIAQRVKEAFEAEGLDAFAYGVLCYDEWEAEPAEYDDAGNIVIQQREAGSRYGIRYEEALALECAYLRAQLKAR